MCSDPKAVLLTLVSSTTRQPYVVIEAAGKGPSGFNTTYQEKIKLRIFVVLVFDKLQLKQAERLIALLHLQLQVYKYIPSQCQTQTSRKKHHKYATISRVLMTSLACKLFCYERCHGATTYATFLPSGQMSIKGCLMVPGSIFSRLICYQELQKRADIVQILVHHLGCINLWAVIHKSLL